MSAPFDDCSPPDDDFDFDPALLPSHVYVCLNDELVMMFDQAPTKKCPKCNAEMLEFAMWDGEDDDDS